MALAKLTLLLLLLFCLNPSASAIAEVIISPRNVIDSMVNEEAKVSDDCKNDIAAYKASVFKDLWAIKMLDSHGKLPDGVLEGNIYAVGSFSSCFEVRASDVDLSRNISGRFCSVFISKADKSSNDTLESWAAVGPVGVFPKAMPISSFGVCVPDTCSESDVTEGLSMLLETDLAEYHVGLLGCESEVDRVSLQAGDIVYLAFVCVFLSLCWLGAMAEAVLALRANDNGNGTPSSQNSLVRLLCCFSLTTSLRKLLNAEKRSGGDQLFCVNGLRFFSMTWVIVGHAYSFGTAMLAIENLVDAAIPGPTNFLFNVVRNALLSVDSFFFMSALLTAYIALREMDSVRKKNASWISFWVMFFVHRYIRLSGVYLIILGFHATLIKYLAVGRVKSIMLMYIGFCESNLGWHALYVNNFVNWSENCLPHTWYMANDFQMFLVSPLILYPLWRFRRAGKATAAAWTVAAILIPMVLTIVFNWPANAYLTTEAMDNDPDWTRWFYYTPWNRFQPYVAGLLTGYALHVTRNKQLRIPRIANVLIWLSVFASGLAVVYGIDWARYKHEGVGLSPFATAMYAGLARLTWGLCLGWVVLACAKGYGGVINTILSWEAFVPMGRLMFCAYLLHMTVLLLVFSLTRTTIAFSHLLMALYIVVTFVGTILVATVFSVVFEAPILNLEKLLLSPQTKKK